MQYQSMYHTTLYSLSYSIGILGIHSVTVQGRKSKRKLLSFNGGINGHITVVEEEFIK